MRLTDMVERVGIDRVLHLCIGFIVTSLGFPLGVMAVVYSLLSAIVLAIVKEIADELRYGGFDITDLLWTVTGASLAFTYYIILL